MSTRRDTEKWSNQMESIVDDMREREAEDRLHPTAGSVSSSEDEDLVDDRMDDEWGDNWCNTCGNMGTINCRCGGDICCCENQGEMECPDCQW